MTERGTIAETSTGSQGTRVGYEYMRFRVDPEIFSRFPDYCVGVVVATGLDNAAVDVSGTLEGVDTRSSGRPWQQWRADRHCRDRNLA